MASAAGGDRDASCTNDPNFAVICVFLEKFGQACGLEYPNFLSLQNFIENTDEVPPELLDLLVKLLRKNRYTVHPELWERALVKFCHTYSNQDAWEVERFGYKKSRLPVKLNILKSLLESQFDRNGKLKTAVGTMKAADLRSHPIGRDKFGNAYWSTIDNKACLIRIYQEHLDEETWQIVASNRDEFAKLIQGLKSDKPVNASLSICDEDSSSNSLNNDKGTDGSTAKTEEISKSGENGDISKVVVVANGNDGEKENIILKITKNRIEESDSDEEVDDEEEEDEEEDDEGDLSKEVVAVETKIDAKSEPQQQSRPSLLASKPPSKKPIVHPKKRANEIESESESKKPKERLTLLGQQHKDKIKTTETENDNMDEEEVEEEEEYSDEEELEEEEVEEEEDEEEEGFEGEDEPEVGEAIEDPLVKVTGEGSGAENKGTFLELIASENCESDDYSEIIEENVRYFYGEGSGNTCQVGNSKQDLTESESKPDLISQTDCLKDSTASTKAQEIEAKKDSSPSDKTINNEAESHQNNVSPNSSNIVDLNSKNEETSQKEAMCTNEGTSQKDGMSKNEDISKNEETSKNEGKSKKNEGISKNEGTESTESIHESKMDLEIESTHRPNENLVSDPTNHELDPTNHNPLVENISETSLENVETCLNDKDGNHPVVSKNQPPERDKMKTQAQPESITKDNKMDIVNRIKNPPVEMVESPGDANDTIGSVNAETDFKTDVISDLEVDESKISNGAKSQEDEPINVVSTSSSSTVKLLTQNSQEELTVSAEKLVFEISKTSIISSVVDKTISIVSESSAIEIPKVMEVNPEISKFNEENLTVTVESSISDNQEENIVELKPKLIEIPREKEEAIKAESAKLIIPPKTEKSIVNEPKILQPPKTEEMDTKKAVVLAKAKKANEVESDKELSSSPKAEHSSIEKPENIALSKGKESTDAISDVTAVPSKDVLLAVEGPNKFISTLVTATTPDNMGMISSKVEKLIDTELENIIDISSKTNKSSIVEHEKAIVALPTAKLLEKVNSPKAQETKAGESETVIVTTSKEIEWTLVEPEKVIIIKPKETLVTVSKTIKTSSLCKLEDTSVTKAENCVNTSEEGKSITKISNDLFTAEVIRKSDNSVTKVEKPVSSYSAKSSISNCKVNEPVSSTNVVKSTISDSKENEHIPIESEKLTNKPSKSSKMSSITEELAASSEPSIELNGIVTPEIVSEAVSNKVQLNQTAKSSTAKSNDKNISVPNPNSKTTISKDLEFINEDKGVKVDEVPEPQKTNSSTDIKIPEIKITEVEHLSKDESETTNKIEPNHLKAPEIDTKDCNAKIINDAKDAPKNVQSFSLDFKEEEEEEAVKSDTTPSTPAKRGRKPKASLSKSKTAKKGGGARKKRIDVEPALIIKEDENETPVRQSRRIAQLKIREEAERRKLEEMVLKQMKEDSDRKKKEEEKKKNPDAVDSDPDADIEQDEDEEEESDSGSEKKILKKPKKKKKKDGSQPWQTSSGSSDSEDNDEELDILEHEEDEELPPLKSDHEFSPESDMEDETQAVPTKRARTVKKDKPKEAEEEEEDDTDDNPEHACQKCDKHDHPEWILLCDICDKGYHCSCLTPVLFIIPEGDWFCPPCQHQKLINIFSVQLEEFDAMIKQKELEENRKRRMNFTNVSAQNVLPISKKEPRARGQKKNRSRNRVPRRRKRSSDDDDDDDDGARTRRKFSSSSSTSSSSSSSGDSDENSSDDEPIYKLRKRRQAAVSYRFNEFDDLINSAIKDEMDEVKGAGNLGRGKDISTIIEADKEEKRLKEQDIIYTEVKEETMSGDIKEIKNVTVESKTEDMELEEPESKKILNDEDLLKEEDEKENCDAESETSDIIRRPTIIKRSSSGSYKGKKKSRKLNSLDIESDDDGSDEDFKGSSSDSEDEEECSLSSASESSLENKWSKKRKKNKSGGRRLRQRRRRVDAAFINDNSDDSDEVKRPVRKRKKKEESDFSDFDDDDEEEEEIDSEDLCDTSTNSDSDSDGAWKPKKKRQKTSSSRKQKVVQKRPAIMIHRKKTKKLDDDEKSFKVGMTKKKVMAKPDSDDSDDETKARKTRGRKITYLEDFDDSSDDGIRPGVKRPDTPPEERALFIKKQEEIKRMLAAKNTDAAKVMATPVLKPLKSIVEEPLISDSISTVPKQIIQNAKVLDPDFLKNKQNSEFDEEFDDQLPEDFDPEDMDEEEIAKMMEEEDFAQQQLKLAGEAIRNKKLKEAELNRKKELEKSKQSHLSEKRVSDTIITPIIPIINPAEPIGPTPLTQLQTIQPPITSAPMIPQTRPMHHPATSILSQGNPLPTGIHPSHMPPGPSPMPNMMMPSMSDTMRLLRPDFDMKKRNRKSILDLGLPRPTGYQATHIPSQMPPQLQQQMMSRPTLAHLPPMAHLPPSAHMPPGPQGPRAFQMQRHLPPHILNQIPPAHSMHSNPVRMAPPNVTVLPPNIPPNIIPNSIPNPNEPIIPTTVLSVANQKPSVPPTSIPSTSHSTSVINSLISPHNARNLSNQTTIPSTQLSVEALNAASQSELDALKRRGRRKKITPLRDPSKPNPGLADLSQGHPVSKTVEAHNVHVEKKSNPILAERLTSSPAGGVVESPVKSVLVAPPPAQIFQPRASATASVITRLQQPPRPHQTPPFSQASSRYFAPPIPRPLHHTVRPPFSGNPPPGMPPVTEPGPHYLTSDSRQPGGGHMFRPSLLHGFTGPSNPLHPLQIPVTQAHLVRGPTPPRDYSGGPTHPPPSFSTPTSQYGEFYPSPNQAVPAIPAEQHQQSSPEQPPSFGQYEPLKSIPVTVAENVSQFETTNDDDTGGDGSQDGGDPGDSTGADGNSNSGPTSEFSGLVSYFSSQQDDLDT